MQDFRSRLITRPMDRSVVRELLQKGQIAKAVRKARAAGISIPQSEIDETATNMIRQHRATELLSLIGVPDVRLPYDSMTLLRAAFDARDYHGFLKQAHRLRITRGLQTEIEAAIDAIQERAPTEADVWRRKFAAM